jgi:hypothetical protein
MTQVDTTRIVLIGTSIWTEDVRNERGIGKYLMKQGVPDRQDRQVVVLSDAHVLAARQ